MDKHTIIILIFIHQACYEAVLHYATPRNYVWDIQYENLSPYGLYYIETLVKTALLPYRDSDDLENPTAKRVPGAGHVELKMEVGGQDNVDLQINSDGTKTQYKNVKALKDVSRLLRNARLRMSHLFAIKAGWFSACDVSPKSVVTYDNVTMNYDLPSCYTLVSADCSPTPHYAVFAKKTLQILPLAVKIYIGGHTIELNPSLKNVIEVKVNDKVVKVEANKPYIVSDIKDVMINKIGAHYLVQIPILKLNFQYTGDDIVNIIPASYRSQHCGICGDYNGQPSRELVGPSLGCNMKDATDLAKSYVLRDKSCKETIQIPDCPL